jgi:hypothetical protein
MTKREAKRVICTTIEFASGNTYLYKLNNTPVCTLSPVEGELYQIVSGTGSAIAIHSFDVAKKTADQFIESLKAFCERLKISNVTPEIITNRFMEFGKVSAFAKNERQQSVLV